MNGHKIALHGMRGRLPYRKFRWFNERRIWWRACRYTLWQVLTV